MKKLIFKGLFLVLGLFLFLSCNKNEDHRIYNGEEPISVSEKSNWPPDINIDVPFEPIRLARAKTTPNHAGRICACNECFGICNRPLENGEEGATIGIEKVKDNLVNLYILNEYPSNFEEEFGIDEEVVLTHEGSNTTFTLKEGLYEAIREEGFVHCKSNGENYSYFVKVQVALK